MKVINGAVDTALSHPEMTDAMAEYLRWRDPCEITIIFPLGSSQFAFVYWVAAVDNRLLPESPEGFGTFLIAAHEAKSLGRSQRSLEWLEIEDAARRDWRWQAQVEAARVSQYAADELVRYWRYQYTRAYVAAGNKDCEIAKRGKTRTQELADIDSWLRGQLANNPEIAPWVVGSVVNAPAPSTVVTLEKPESGATVTVTGEGRVVASSAPVGYFDRDGTPPPSGFDATWRDAGTPAPVVFVPPSPAAPPETDWRGQPLTDSSPGTGAGTPLNSTVAVVTPGAPVGVSTQPASPPGVMQMPEWVLWLGVALLALLVVRR